MSSTSSSPTNPLQDRGWRLRHSAWLLAPILGCGFFSFVGFLYCAVRIRSAKWWKIAAVTGALTAVAYLLMGLFSESEDSTSNAAGPADDLAVAYVMALWIGLIIYGLVVNRDYLRWRAGDTTANAWYNQPVSAAPPARVAPPPLRSSAPPPPPPPPAPVLGVDTSRYYAPPKPTPESPPAPSQQVSPPTGPNPVDMNSASAMTIASAFGLDAATADRIVSVRERRRGFHGLDDLVAQAGLQPHQLVRLRGRATFETFKQQAPPTDAAPEHPASPEEPRSGRILDY
jgi:hypothetical protein